MSDAYKDTEATHWIGCLNAILTATMALSSIVGGYLSVYFSWNPCYTGVAFITAMQLILIFPYPETGKGPDIQLKPPLRTMFAFSLIGAANDLQPLVFIPFTIVFFAPIQKRTFL